MARAALELGVRELATLAGVSAMTVTRFENGRSAGYPETLDRLRTALETAGVIFVPGNGDGPGVRLRKTARAATDLDDHIETLKANLPHVDEAAPPSPAKAMRQLERAHGKNEIVKAKGKRVKK